MTGPAVQDKDKTSEGSSTTIIPGTQQPPAQATSGVPEQELENARKLIALQEGVMRDAARRENELTQRLRGMEERVSKIEAPGPTEEQRNNDFWKNPHRAVAEIVAETVKTEMARTVGPLNERLQKSDAETAYDRAKARIKAMPQFKDVWQHIEGAVDEFARGAAAKGVEVNDALVDTAAINAFGAFQLGLLPNKPGAPNPPAPTPPARTTVQDPPHLRPSVAAIPGRETNDKPAIRELTENEKRLAREKNQTPEQFLEWLAVPAQMVIHSTIGKPEVTK